MPNWSNYQSLNSYNENQLGIPFPRQNYFQVVPSWSNVSYTNPNYNSLTFGSGNNYATVAQAYPVVTVQYAKRNC